MKNNINAHLWLSRIGLGLIFCYCLLASIFFSYFAQLHLSLSFLPFPIFIGEIVMGICLLLLVGVCKGEPSFSSRTRFLLGLYFGWVLVRALINYHYDGPLALRNAALFYYPIFAVFSYCFYQKAKIPRNILMLLVFWAAGILLFKIMHIWYWWTYVISYVIAVSNIKSVKWRRFGWIFLAVILLLGKEYFYQGSRAHIVGVFCAIVFLVSYFGALLAQRRHYVKLGILFISFIIYTLGYFVFSVQDTISSLTSIKPMMDTYNVREKQYQENKGHYVPENLSVHLYNPKKMVVNHPSPSPSPVQPSGPALTVVESMKNFIGYNISCNRLKDVHRFDVAEGDVVFRLFVWRDMARELIEKKAWWGFSFGHPQRSRSLEVLGWAQSEWGRDGWIAPHNSFFHIIYRAGILGVLFIGVLFFLIGRLVGDFFNLNSIKGGFLISALVYWMVLANFFVILEFPYNAILIWTLFGIAMAYRDELKTKTIK